MLSLIILWFFVLFLPIACSDLVKDSFDGSELKQMGIAIQ
jgi:hypothetical protein